MNLADIRRKAQQGDRNAGYAPAPAQPVAKPEPAAAEQAPEPSLEESEQAAASDPGSQGGGELILPEFCEYEPDQFDPATVILKGRQTAALGEDLPLAEGQSADLLEVLCFKVAQEEYALSIMDIKEIIKPREVTEVPRVPSFVRGILSLRGIIIPIFDMRVRLGLPGGAASERERIIVVKRANGFCGVLVDEVVQVVRIPDATIEPPPVVLEGIDREFVQGIGRVGGRMLILLDMEKVLDVGLF